MALKDKKTGDPLDGIKVGDYEIGVNEDGSVARYEAVIICKTFNRDGVAAKVAELNTTLAAFNEILAEMDKAK